MEKRESAIYEITLEEICKKFEISGNLCRWNLREKCEWDNGKHTLILEVRK